MAKPSNLYWLKQRGKFWYYHLSNEDHHVWHSTKTEDKKQAIEIIRNALSGIEVPKVPTDARERLLAQLERVRSDKQGLTFSSYARDFFNERSSHIQRQLKNDRMTERWRREGEGIVKRFLLKREFFPMGDKSLGSFTTADISALQLHLDECFVAHHYSRSYLERIYKIIKTIFNEAVYQDFIQKSPIKSGQLFVKINQKRIKEVGIFTKEDLDAIFSSSWDNPIYYAMFLTARYTGMRRGEVLALTWGQIDFDKKVVRVDNAFKDDDRKTEGLPKWSKTRTTPFPDKLIPILQALPKRSKYVFSHKNGNAYSFSQWNKIFREKMDQVGIDYKKRNLKPHSFRHTLNTMLLQNGIPSAVVRAILGWNDGKVQDAYYTHFNNDLVADFTKIINKL